MMISVTSFRNLLGLTELSINVPKLIQKPIIESNTPNSVIESIQFDSNLSYIAPHSPTITENINNDLCDWNGQLILKSIAETIVQF